MKPKDPSIIEVTQREQPSYKKANQYMGIIVKAKTRNEFVQNGAWYVVSLLPDGFKLRIPSLTDKKMVRADHGGHVSVTGAPPGLYDIIEQTEDYIIAKKQKS